VIMTVSRSGTTPELERRSSCESVVPAIRPQMEVTQGAEPAGFGTDSVRAHAVDERD